MNDCTQCEKYRLVRHMKFGVLTHTEDFCAAFGGWPEPDHCCYFKRRGQEKNKICFNQETHDTD